LDRRNRRWLQDYRDLGEWAVLYDFLTNPHRTFATNTLVVRDGFLRSKLFARHPQNGYLFARMWERIRDAVERHRGVGRRIYVVGIAKRSKVLDRYRMAMFLEGVMAQPGPCYVRIPGELERRVYRWEEFAPGRRKRRGSSGSSWPGPCSWCASDQPLRPHLGRGCVGGARESGGGR
jgi:hypothetical protein